MGRTALHVAAEFGHAAAVRTLLDNGKIDPAKEDQVTLVNGCRECVLSEREECSTVCLGRCSRLIHDAGNG